MVLGPGTNFGPYRIRAVLGHSSFASVYRAWHLQRECDLALKMLESEWCTDATVRHAFGVQALLARLRHPHLITVYDADEVDGVPYFSMELLTGELLTQRGNSEVASLRPATSSTV